MSTEVQAPETFSQTDVASRHAEMFKNMPTEGAEPSLPNGTDLAALATQDLEKKKASEVKKETKNETGIPDEILGLEKKQEKPEDEWETLHNEEIKGHVKNENYKKYREATGKKISSIEAEKQALKKEYEDYKSKFGEGKVPESVTKELETYRVKLKEREDELGKLAVERSPVFKEKFTDKQDSLLKQIKKAGDDLELDSATQLVGMSLKKRLEVLSNSELSPAAQGHIISLLQQNDQLESAKEEYLADWENKKAQMDQEQARLADSRKADLKKHEEKIFASTIAEMAEKFSPLKEIKDNEKWNATRESIIQKAKAMYEGEFETAEFAKTVLAGHAAEALNEINQNLIKLYRETKAELESLKAANPDVTGQHTNGEIADGKSKDRFQRHDAQSAFREIVGAARLNEVA